MTPALAAAASAAAAAQAPLRMAFVYVPERRDDGGLDAHGRGRGLRPVAHPEAAGADEGPDARCSRASTHNNGNALGDGAGDHARAGAAFLTGVHCRKTAGADIKNGVSVDQIAAQQLGLADALRLARARLRGHAHRRQLRLGLLLRLHQHLSWRTRDDAAAAGDEPAAGVRAAVRRRRRAGPGRRARSGSAAARSILDFVATTPRSLQRRSAAATGASSTST